MQPQPPTSEAPETAPATLAPMQRALDKPPRITADNLLLMTPGERRDNLIAQLADVEVARQTYQQYRAMAMDLMISGSFSQNQQQRQNPQQLLALLTLKLMFGKNWGMSDADAIASIYIVNGKPAVENNIVAGKLRAAGIMWEPQFYFEDVTYKNIDMKRCIGCRLWLSRWSRASQSYEPIRDPGTGEQATVSFTELDASVIDTREEGRTIKLSEKAMYKQWPQDMYYWRCIARVKKYYAPHVLRGGVIQEEALDVVPVEESAPEELPADLQPSSDLAGQIEAPPEPERPSRPSLRDVLEQESFLDEPGREPGEGE
jgi:hypothetical protein